MSLTQDFVVFWQQYPRKVGKLAAQKAYAKARHGGATQRQLVDGIASYVAHKPAYADFCHPATWLNQGRWLDEYDTPRQSTGYDWFEECKAVHGGSCGLDRYRHIALIQAEARERGEAI